MSDEAYYIAEPSTDPLSDDRWDECYSMLRGPDGFYCLLTEPEDRTWHRDGSVIVRRLNEYATQLAAARRERDELRERVEAALAVIDTPGIQWHRTLGQVSAILREPAGKEGE